MDPVGKLNSKGKTIFTQMLNFVHWDRHIVEKWIWGKPKASSPHTDGVILYLFSLLFILDLQWCSLVQIITEKYIFSPLFAASHRNALLQLPAKTDSIVLPFMCLEGKSHKVAWGVGEVSVLCDIIKH